MKFEYKFSVGDTVYYEGTELTIRRKCGLRDTPHYWVSENDTLYAERDLSATPPQEDTEEVRKERAEEQAKREYEQSLKYLDRACPSVAKYSRNLNLLALKGELNPTYNREKEVAEIKTVLLRRTKPNPLLLGVAGCGKTAVVEEVARAFVSEYLKSGGNPHTPVIYDLSLNSLVSGCRCRGDFEERLAQMLKELAAYKNIIIFIDEIHSLNAIGASEGSTSAGQILKPALARGDIRVIGATTTDEYKEHIAKDKALARRFSRIDIAPLIGAARTTCITSIIVEYGQYFGVDTSAVSVETVQHIIDDVIPDTVFPDNVIDILDETLANAKYGGKKAITDADIKKTASRQHGIIII